MKPNGFSDFVGITFTSPAIQMCLFRESMHRNREHAFYIVENVRAILYIYSHFA